MNIATGTLIISPDDLTTLYTREPKAFSGESYAGFPIIVDAEMMPGMVEIAAYGDIRQADFKAFNLGVMISIVCAMRPSAI